MTDELPGMVAFIVGMWATPIPASTVAIAAGAGHPSVALGWVFTWAFITAAVLHAYKTDSPFLPPHPPDRRGAVHIAAVAYHVAWHGGRGVVSAVVLPPVVVVSRAWGALRWLVVPKDADGGGGT